MKTTLSILFSIVFVYGFSQNKVILTLPSGSGGSTDTTSLSNRINLKVDSITKSMDSVFFWRNGEQVFAFKDSSGGGGSFVAGNGIKIDGDVIGLADTLFEFTNIHIGSNEALNFQLLNNNSFFRVYNDDGSNPSLQFNSDDGGVSETRLLYSARTIGSFHRDKFLNRWAAMETFTDQDNLLSKIKTDSMYIIKADDNASSSGGAYAPTTTSTTKYKVVLMDSTTGALVTTAPSNIGGGGSTDTTSLSNRIDEKLNIVDTAGITAKGVANYVNKGDSLVLTLIDGTRFPVLNHNDTAHYRRTTFFTDFLNTVPNNDGGGLTTASNGTGAGVSQLTTAADLADRPGVMTLSTGTTTGRTGFMSGFSYVYKSPNILMWEADIRINQLSNSTDGYALTLGFIPAINTVTQRPAIMFVYDSEGALTANSGSPFWKIAANRSTPSVLNNYQLATGDITPSTGWTRLKIIVRDISSVPTAEFYINGTLVGSLTTQIPFEDAVRVGAYFSKNVGTTPATIDIDFMKVDYIMPNGRNF